MTFGHTGDLARLRRLLSVAAAALIVTACGPGAFRDDPQEPSDPAYPGAELIRDTRSGQTCCFAYLEGGRKECPVLLTDYGSDDSIEDVVKFYEEIGFQVKGEPGLANEEGEPDPEGELVRWIGLRQGDETTWRQADIATGEIFGTPEWNTAFSIWAPDC